MNFDPALFLLEENSSITEALSAIDANQRGLIFLTNSLDKVSGLLTDGDIRRALVSGSSLDDLVKDIANKEFVFALPNTPREEVLKYLDSRVKEIPILDDGRLVNLVSRDYFPVASESSICVRSRAPVRVSFGGGGSDVTHFFELQRGAVLNAAVSLYAHATLRPRSDSTIRIFSGDLDAELQAEDLDSAIKSKGPFGLLQAVLSVVRPVFGFDLHLYSDFGVGSGLGGSASVAVSVLGCFNALRSDQWTRYEIAELAFQAERLYLGVAGGWQDQYAAAFGGINFIEFNVTKNIVTPLAVSRDILNELQESLVLCNTGITHQSGDIHEDQKLQMAKSDKKQLVTRNVQLTEGLKDALVSGDLSAVGRLMHQGWQIKRQLSSKISSPNIDKIYDSVMERGALGGKILGAGGGGYFLFYVEALNQLQVRKHLEEIGLAPQPVNFDMSGLVSWKVRVD